MSELLIQNVSDAAFMVVYRAIHAGYACCAVMAH